MLGYFKKSLSLVLSILVAVPAYSLEAGVAPSTGAAEVEAKINRSPEDIMKAFIEQWNAAGNLDNLVKLLKLPEKEVALFEKLKKALKVKKQKLPQAEFNENNSMVYMDKHKMQILSFAPLALSIEGKVLFFNQDKIEEQIDYLIKEVTSVNKKSVFLELLLPKAHAEFNYKTMFYIMGGFLTLTTLWTVWNNYQEAKAENRRVISESLPEYKGFGEEVAKKRDTRVSYMNCNERNKLLQKLSFYKKNGNKEDLYEYTYDDSIVNNDVRTATITSGNLVCKFVVEDAIWKRFPGMPAECRAPSINPYKPLDFEPVDEAKACCKDSHRKCPGWVANDLVEGRPIGSSAAELKKASQQ
jgi:hypothetical protein